MRNKTDPYSTGLLLERITLITSTANKLTLGSPASPFSPTKQQKGLEIGADPGLRTFLLSEQLVPFRLGVSP